MRFRKWMKIYRQERYDAVPDIRETLAEAREQARGSVKVSVLRPWQRIAALAASAAIVIGLSSYLALSLLKHVTSSVTPHTTKTTTVTKAPNSTDKPSTRLLAISLNRYLPVSLLGAVDKYATARIVRLRADLMTDEHKDCLGVSYDTKKQKIVCPQHTVTATLNQKGISATSAYIHAYHPSYGTVVFTLIEDDKSSYFYDMSTDTLQKLSVSFYQCPGNVDVQSNTPYVVLWRGGGNNDIYAIQMETGEITNILQDKNGKYLGTPMDDVRLSACGKYAIYTLGEGNDPNGPGRTTVFYTFATKQLRKFTGELCEEIPTMGCFLLNTPKGYVKYDIATGATTPLASSDIPKQYYKHLKKDEVDLTYECYRLILCDRVTGNETPLCEEFVYAHSYSPDRRYLCYYIRGEKYVRVKDLQNGADSTIQFDVSPTEQTEGEELKNRALLFSIAFEGENELILLYATNGNHRVDPYEALAYKQSFPYYHLHNLKEAEQLVSVLSLEDLLRRFPENIVAFEGDGFLCLDYTPLTRSETGGMVSNRQVLIEDYDGGIAYDICHTWKDYTSEFTGDRVGDLSTGAEEQTRMLLEELGIPIQSAPRDYRPYFSSDSEVVMKQHLADLNADVVDSNFNCYFVYMKDDNYSGSRLGLESPKQKQELIEFVRFTDTLSYSSVEDITPYVHFNYTYLIRFHLRDSTMLEMYVGHYNGQYFFSKKDYVATITAEQYAKWQPWLETKSQEGHLD